MCAIAELSELTLGFVALAERAARVECCGCASKFSDRPLVLVRLAERATRERTRDRALDRCAALLRGDGGVERVLYCAGCVACVQLDRCRRARRPCPGKRKPHCGGTRLRARACALRLGDAVECEPAAG